MIYVDRSVESYVITPYVKNPGFKSTYGFKTHISNFI